MSLVLFTLMFAHSWSSMSLNPLTCQPHSNFQQGGAVFTASWVQLRLELLVCDRSVSANVITHTFVGLKCLTETKIQISCDHVDHTRFHIVEMKCQMVQLLSAHIVGPTMFVNLTPEIWHTSTVAVSTNWCQEIGNLSILVLRKLVFHESLLFHYIMIDIGFEGKRSDFIAV